MATNSEYENTHDQFVKNKQLFDAAKEGRHKDVIQLISGGADHSWMNPGWDGQTPLHVARTPAVAEVLVNAQANVNAIDEIGQTPVYLASKYGLTSVVDSLVELGADCTIPDNEGQTPLHVAKTPDVAEVHVKAQANVNAIDKIGQTPVYLASKYGLTSVVDSLVELRADCTIPDNKGRTPLHVALTAAVAEVLVKAQANVNAIDENGQTALFQAMHSVDNSEELVSLLLKEGARVDIIDNAGQSPVYLASKYGHKDIVDILVKNGADCTIPDNNCISPLQVLQSNAEDETEFAKKSAKFTKRVNIRRMECLVMLEDKYGIVPTKDVSSSEHEHVSNTDKESSSTNIVQNNDTDSAADPLASILPSINTGKKCDYCQEMHEQVEILAKDCVDKEKVNNKLQKKLTQLQVSDLPDMMEATADIQMQWREMGVALGISTTVLDEISSLEPFDELRCLYELLRHWILDIGATWGGLVGAMRSSNVNQKDIAEHLELKHHGGGLSDGSSLQVQTIVKDEKPITESDVSTVVEAVFHFEDKDIHTDWKVLGLMLGLNDSILDTIQSADDHNYERAMLKHWIVTGKAYWSVLIDVIAGHVIDERQIARAIAKKFLNLDLYLPGKILEDDIYVSGESIEEMKQRILNKFDKNKKAIGIAFIIGMGDSAGTDVDGDGVASVLRQLNFVTLRMEDSSREELSCLVKTVALGKCPISKFFTKIIFYYAGHGGIDKHGNSYMLVKGEQKFFINANMIAHFKENVVKKKQICLFLLDCCLSGQLNPGYEPTMPSVPIRCLIAFATSLGLKSYGDMYAGGAWTRRLCSHLKEKRSVSDILATTHTEVGSDQRSVHASCAGAVFLNGVPNYFDGDSSDELDPVKIWDRHSKEIVEQLGYSNTLIALTSGLCIEHVIDKETKNAIMSVSNGGGDILVKAVKEKITGPETLHLVLDVMEQRDELCGLVRRMRRELGILEDKPKNILKDHHDEILELLHTAATDNTIVSLCGGLSSKRLIDGKTFYDVTSEKCTSGPNTLLKCLEEKVDKEPTMIISIINIMGEEEVLEEIVEKMREALKLQKLHSPTAKLPAKFLRPQQVIEQLETDNSRLKEENIQLQNRVLLIKVFLVVSFLTLSIYFVTRKLL